MGSSLINNPAMFSNPYTAAAAIAVDVGETILRFIHVGGGCGEACIDAAKMEQVFEVAGDYVSTWVQAGYLSGPEGSTALNQIKTLGQQNLSQLGTQQAQNGARNMDGAMSGNFRVASSGPSTPSKTWDRNAALNAGAQHTPPAAGWYQDAYAKGQALAVQVVEQGILPHRPVTSSLSADLGSITGGGSNSKLLLYAAGAFLLAKKILL